MQKRLAIHLFRRDLRLEDNTALIAALSESEKVLPCFIFDPRQVDKNDYRSDNCVQFMIDSLRDLKGQLNAKGGKLFLFYGKTQKVLEMLLKETNAFAVFCNRDYTPFSKKRDRSISEVCKNFGAEFFQFDDALIVKPEEIVHLHGKPYTVFSHFFRRAGEFPVDMPKKNSFSNYYSKKISFEESDSVFKNILKIENKNIFSEGGRKEAQKILRKIASFKNYENERNFPAVKGTTGLSAHNKFGTVSIREVYHAICGALGKKSALISELYWRDFFTHVAFNFPYVFGKEFDERFQKMRWSYDKKRFKAWCDGKSGFPIVDAGMRELNSTGYMHNRVRMVVASFLTKDLHIDWRWGEKYFAQKLVDYDPSVNNGNWQWSAGVGVDKRPLRIFNPWLQQEKFDPDCVYIKKWIPELKNFSVKQILNHEKENLKGYYSPIVNHAIEQKIAKELFESCKKTTSK